MRVRVEHDHGEGEDVRGVRGGEDARVTPTVPRRERFHHAIDLLRLAGKTKRPAEKRAERDVKLRADEIVRVDEGARRPRRLRRSQKFTRGDGIDAARGKVAKKRRHRERVVRVQHAGERTRAGFTVESRDGSLHGRLRRLGRAETSGLGRARCSAFARRRLRRSDVLRSDVLRRFVVFARSMFVGI